MIHFDVVLVTHMRSLLLAQSVNSLQMAAIHSKSLAKVNLHLLLNGPDPLTQKYLRKFAVEGDALNVRIQYSKNTLTASRARNLLLKNCSNPWIVFIDDDAYVDIHYFTVLTESIKRHVKLGAIGGPNLTPPSSSFFQKASGAALESFWGAGPYRKRYSPSSSEFFCTETSLILCNLCFINKGWEFTDSVKHGEENLLLHNLQKQDSTLKFLYQPNLCVYHHRRATIPSFIRQMFKSGVGRGELILKSKNIDLTTTMLLAFSIQFFRQLFLKNLSDLNIGIISLYFIVCVIACLVSAFQNSLGVGFTTFFIFPLIHSSYVTGLLWSFLRLPLNVIKRISQLEFRTPKDEKPYSKIQS